MQISRLLAAATVLAWAVACDGPASPPEPPPAPATPSPRVAAGAQSDTRTPFQRSIMQAIAERQAQGLPVPANVTYEYQQGPAAAPKRAAPQGAPSGEETVTVTARTTIQFTNPEEAGLTQWPPVVVEGEVPQGGTGFVHAGDYTQMVKDRIAQQYPDANVPFETGPRTYTVAETLTVATPAGAPASIPMAAKVGSLATLTTAKDLLMGFTVLGPNVDYHVEWSEDFCVIWFFGCRVEVELLSFWAGFKMDWTIATRLPMAMSVNSEQPVLEGSTFTPTTAATGVNWSSSDFSAVGVSPEDGNEFVLKFIFKLGLFVEVFDESVINLGVDLDLDRASSFATPLGAGQMFDLPSIDVSIWNPSYGVASADVGVQLTPMAGSNRYLANWTGFDQASGSGAITYTASGQPVALGTMTATDGPGNAGVRLSDFRYYFNQFGLGLGLYFGIWVMGFGGTWTIPITQFALSTGDFGPYVETHAGTPSAVELSIPIQNVAPTVTLSRSGSVMLNGEPTFLAQAGQTLSFQGDVTDPGRDDLTLSWDWGDGAPAPDVSTSYQTPYAVTERQTHSFGEACLYEVSLTGTDDDQGVGRDHVEVAVTGAGGPVRLEGYWQHQLSRVGATDFDDAALECLLRVVDQVSAVFGELRDVSSVAAARDVLFLQQNGGSALEQLDRELLVAWLNYASGAFAYDELVDLNGDRVRDTPFAAALAQVEAIRADPGQTERALRVVTGIVHGVSAAASRGEATPKVRP